MASKYSLVRAEGQQDKNACWAACLAWWLRATNNINKQEQWELISSDEYAPLWDQLNDGGRISEDGIKTIIKDSRWDMSHQKLDSGRLLDYALIKEHLSFGPIYIGFNDIIQGGNHVNIIYEIFGDENYPQVNVMEPAFFKKKDATFRGEHLTRGLMHYRAPNVVYLARPKLPISLDR